jgi:protein-S-isoprenylcysteine O-methyltransferase Ste14
MSLSAVWRLRWLVGWFAATGIRVFWVRRAHRRDRPETKTEAALLALAGIGNSAIPWVYVWWRGLDRLDYRLPRPIGIAAGVIGAILDTAGNWLIWASHADLGSNWHAVPVATADQTLVTSGVYRYVRHPMYAGHLLWGAGQALLLQNLVAGPAALLTLIPLLLFRTRREEQQLADRFGAEYARYASSTGGLLPKLRGVAFRGQ